MFKLCNFLEPSGPVQACNGTALPVPLPGVKLKTGPSRTVRVPALSYLLKYVTYLVSYVVLEITSKIETSLTSDERVVSGISFGSSYLVITETAQQV